MKPRKAAPPDPRLNAYAQITRILDRAFRLPGTQWRFGLDAILGVVPGAGDIAGSIAGAYGLWLSRQLGAPLSIQLRMLLNLGIDAVVGVIPLAGDIFDFAFKAHDKNYALLSSWLATPHTTHRTSVAFLGVTLLGLLAIVAGAVWMLVASIQWLRHAFS